MMKDFSERFLKLLNEDFATLNLTRITDPEEFYQKQIIDSIEPTTLFESFDNEIKKGLHLDIGFGGGFPLLPLAYKYPDTKFIGFEARRKKSDAVNEIASLLGLENVKTYHHRIETVEIDVPCSISFKAVGKIQEFLKKINLSSEAKVYFYKGPNVHELENPKEKIANFRKLIDKPYGLSGTLGRTFIAYEGSIVPRGTKKNLVKLSELL